ncbi:MAG: sortase [Ruminococcus sp.]|nr:sortase [Ruminococcus sp.]
MSDESKATGSVPGSGDGYFEKLIEDFDLNSPVREEAPKPGLKDFSRFFNDAAAFGGGFESTIDKEAGKQLTAEIPLNEGATLDFSGGMRKAEEIRGGEIITTPVTDEDGMIVIYDEEAGIDATSVAESAERFTADSSLSEEETAPAHMNEAAHTDEPKGYDESEEGMEDMEENGGTAETDYSADSNMEEDSPAHMMEKPAEGKKKRPFIAGLLPWAGDGVGEIIRKIVFLVSACVFAGAGIMLIGTLSDSEEAIEEQQSLQSMITTTAATSINEIGETVTVPPTPEERITHASSLMDSFVEVSGNVKGILEIPGLDINYPVVQGTDNDYYLTHTYDDRKNRAGAIFMDYRCTHTAEYTSPNLVLYGHNQNDGTMFGKLKYYKNNVNFYKNSPMIYFNTEFEAGDYVIFGYFISNVHEYQDSSGEVFHYHDYIETLNNESTFNWYMGKVKERNQIISPVDVVYGDRLLVLSTCSSEYSDSRFVVMARKLRENESYSSFNFKAATLNPYAKQIDWAAILSSNSVPAAVINPAMVSAVDGVPNAAEGILASAYQMYESNMGAAEEISDVNTDIQVIDEEAVPDDIPISEETQAVTESVTYLSETEQMPPPEESISETEGDTASADISDTSAAVS